MEVHRNRTQLLNSLDAGSVLPGKKLQGVDFFFFFVGGEKAYTQGKKYSSHFMRGISEQVCWPEQFGSGYSQRSDLTV